MEGPLQQPSLLREAGRFHEAPLLEGPSPLWGLELLTLKTLQGASTGLDQSFQLPPTQLLTSFTLHIPASFPTSQPPFSLYLYHAYCTPFPALPHPPTVLLVGCFLCTPNSLVRVANPSGWGQSFLCLYSTKHSRVPVLQVGWHINKLLGNQLVLGAEMPSSTLFSNFSSCCQCGTGNSGPA